METGHGSPRDPPPAAAYFTNAVAGCWMTAPAQLLILQPHFGQTLGEIVLLRRSILRMQSLELGKSVRFPLSPSLPLFVNQGPK